MWVVIPASLIFLAFCFKKQKEGETILPRLVLQTLNSTHYQPVEIDDSFSNKVFELYLKRLDGSKRFFLASDYDKFAQYRYSIDDEAKAGTYEFLNLVNTTFEERVDQLEAIFEKILAQKFEFESDEKYEFDEDNRQYLNTMEELAEDWRKYVKLSVLEKYYTKVTAQEKALADKQKDFVEKSLDSLEHEARLDVLNSQRTWFKRLQKFGRDEQIDMYINCMTSVYDPHTNYFPPKEKEDFDIRMSGRLEGIGAQLSLKDGNLKVEMIVPGSPSYLQGELQAGDVIIKVTQKDSMPVNVTNMEIDEAVQLIRGKKGTTVILTVRKPDGTIKDIPIVRDVVIMEEGYVKSAIIQKGRDKYGFIYLPQFYTDLNNRGGKTCSDDVKNEVLKLMKEDVKGIVFDLRNNGGGSLQDVVDMTGIFVGHNPVVQVKYRDRSATVLTSGERKIIYKGPLVVMVNKYSASASEIMAASLQDYQRALILGTDNRTFGKGTVQRFLDLDRYAPPGTKYGLGSLKVTIQKFYRVNGGTTQFTGVIPDVVMPNRYASVKVGEETEDFPLQWSEIDPLPLKMDMGSQAKKITSATLKSKKRIEESPIFKLIAEDSKRIEANNKRTIYSLRFKDYKADQENWEKQNKSYDEQFKSHLTENNMLALKSDLEQIGSDSVKLKIKNDWLNTYKKDVYLNEAVNIIEDL